MGVTPKPPYTWDRTAGRYRDAGGRFVAMPDVRAAVDAVIAGSADRLGRLAAQHNAGRISLADFQAGLVREVKALHLAQLAAGAGGWAQLDAREYGHVGAILRGQYAYLTRFVAAIADGSLSAAQIAARARLYAAAGRATYEAARLRSDQRAGLTEERNRLNPVRTAHCVECLQLTALGWVPIGTIKAIGSRLCTMQDHCTIERR